MLHLRRQQLTYALAVSDGAILIMAFAISFWLRDTLQILQLTPQRPLLASHLWMIMLALPLFWVLASYQRLYQRLHATSRARLVANTFIVFVFLGLLLGTAIFIFQ